MNCDVMNEMRMISFCHIIHSFDVFQKGVREGCEEVVIQINDDEGMDEGMWNGGVKNWK